MSKLKDLAEKQKTLKAEIAANSKDALGEAFAELFEAHPTIEAIKWKQYTPYFNDGDPCVFRADDFYFRKVDAAKPAESTEVDYDDYEEGESGWEDSWYSRDATPEKSAVKELRSFCDEEVLLHAFGDHVTVTATRKGFDVEEYEHS